MLFLLSNIIDLCRIFFIIVSNPNVHNSVKIIWKSISICCSTFKPLFKRNILLIKFQFFTNDCKISIYNKTNKECDCATYKLQN